MKQFKNLIDKLALPALALFLCVALLSGCSTGAVSGSAQSSALSPASDAFGDAALASGDSSTAAVASAASGGLLDGNEMFTDRDLEQTADVSNATAVTVSDGTDVTIAEAGVYVLSGTASDVTVYVEAADDAKVQLVLDGLSLTNSDFPCIYVKSADKVFVTTTDCDNSLSVTGSFRADGDTNTDGVIFSRSDLVLNGIGCLTVASTDNGVVCKDDLKITGGDYTVNADSKAFEANDSIRIAGGSFTLTSGTDALHAENEDDATLGYIYICGGSFEIQVGDDGVHANSVLQIDGGTLNITAAEGLEATYIQINDGEITISASGDGINAANKSSAYTPTFELNGGTVTISMGAGDTDGVDSNGNITINGGTISVTGNSTFDYDGTATYNGGTIIVNGEQVDSIPNQFMGGMGGMNGFPGGDGSFPAGDGSFPSDGTFPGGDGSFPAGDGTFPDSNSGQGGFPGGGPGGHGEGGQGGFPGGSPGNSGEGSFPGEGSAESTEGTQGT